MKTGNLSKVSTNDYVSRKDICRSNNCNTGSFELGNLASRVKTVPGDDYSSADEPMSTCIHCSGDFEQDADQCWLDSVKLRSVLAELLGRLGVELIISFMSKSLIGLLLSYSSSRRNLVEITMCKTEFLQ